MKKLLIIIRGSKQCADAAWNYGKDWPLLRDHEAQLVNHEEFKKLIPDAPKHWTVGKHDHGIVINEDAMKYTKTTNELRQGFVDFLAGYQTCENDFNNSSKTN